LYATIEWNMYKDLLHHHLRVPYLLHVEELRRPKSAAKTVVLIHGIGSSTAMWRALADDLPDDLRVVAVDLLGFGRSPKPDDGRYDAATQATSLLATLIRYRVPLGAIFVGHSLGSLVAVEAARRFPYYPSALVLISPPIYRPSKGKGVATQREDILRGIYKILQLYPKNTERALLIAKRLYAKRTKAGISKEVNISSFLTSLNASIINQSTIDHIGDIRPPIRIISGSRDPLVISQTLDDIAKTSPTIHHRFVKRGGHNVVGIMHRATRDELASLLQ